MCISLQHNIMATRDAPVDCRRNTYPVNTPLPVSFTRCGSNTLCHGDTPVANTPLPVTFTRCSSNTLCHDYTRPVNTSLPTPYPTHGGNTLRPPDDTPPVNTSLPTPFSRCALLSITVPDSRVPAMCRILKPFVRHFPLVGNAVEIVDQTSGLIPQAADLAAPRVPPYTVTAKHVSAPALAVILFLPEFGTHRAERVRTRLLHPPWTFHHSIQLHTTTTTTNRNNNNNNTSSSTSSRPVIGQHDFYSLSRGYPLWSVGTANQMTRRLRVKVMVRRYAAMVEFYRLLTGAEMESSKQGFCIFSLNTRVYEDNTQASSTPSPSSSAAAAATKLTSSPLSLKSSSSSSSLSSYFPSSSSSSTCSSLFSSSVSSYRYHATSSPRSSSKGAMTDDVTSSPADVTVELALKHCPHIVPYPLTNAYLTFPVPNLQALSDVLHTSVRPLTSFHYLVHDPDGNPVILVDMSASKNSNSPRLYRNPSLYDHDTGKSYSVSAQGQLAAMSRTKHTGTDKTSLASDSYDSGRFSDSEMSWSVTELDLCMARLFPGQGSHTQDFRLVNGNINNDSYHDNNNNNIPHAQIYDGYFQNGIMQQFSIGKHILGTVRDITKHDTQPKNIYR